MNNEILTAFQIKQRPVLVTNLVPIKYSSLNLLTTEIILAAGGTVTFDDPYTARCVTHGGVGERAFIEILVNTTIGKLYAFSVEVVSLSGTGGGKTSISAHAAAVTEGDAEILDTGVNIGRNMIVFRAAATTTSQSFRFGIGLDGGINTAFTIVVKNPMIQELDSGAIGASSLSWMYPYTQPGQTQTLDYVSDGYYNNADNLYVPATIKKFPIPRSAVGVVLADSFSNAATEIGSQINTKLAGITYCYNNGGSGRQLAQLASDIDNILPLGGGVTEKFFPVSTEVILERIANQPDPGFAVIVSGVNDISANGSSTNNPLPAMQAAIATLVARFRARDMSAIICNVSPWKLLAGFSLTQLDQMHTDAWNKWLANYCAVEGLYYVDMYSILEDPAAPDALLPAYNSGDGLHPNAAGSSAVADAIIKHIGAL